VSLDERLKDWAETRQHTPDTPALLARHEQRKRPWAWFAAPALTTALVAALVLVLVRTPAPTVDPPRVEPIAYTSGLHMLDGRPVELEGRARFDGGTVVLIEGEVTVEGHEVLVEGRRITGDRFRVALDPLRVFALRGEVQIEDRDQALRRVLEGQCFPPEPAAPEPPPVEEAAPPPTTPAAPHPPDLDTLRAAVLKGEDVRSDLQWRLRLNPDESGSWTLMAQLEQKQGNPDAAIGAWLEVVRTGAPLEVQTARFSAARLMEHRPAEAEPLLRAYLKASGPLEAEARLRLGKALVAQDRTDEAEIELTRVVEDHAGTPTAQLAQSLLDQDEVFGPR